MDSVRIILAGLAATMVVALLVRKASSTAAIQQDGWKHLRPGRSMYVTTFIVLCAAGFIDHAASRAGPGQETIAAVVAGTLSLGALYLAYVVFFSRFRWNEDTIESWHPLGAIRRIKWDEVSEGGYNTWLQSFWIRDSQGRRIWYSPMWQGVNSFHDEIERRLGPVAPRDFTSDANDDL